MRIELKTIARKILIQHDISKRHREYKNKFVRHSFIDCDCESYKQFEASVTRLYHTIEKGLSYSDYRAGFGKDNVDCLIESMEQYCLNGFDTDAFFYKTALSCLQAYIAKNEEYGENNPILSSRVSKLKGHSNNLGGVIKIKAPDAPECMNYEQLIKNRHSIRHFSDTKVDINILKEAIELAQFTPSACNRQGWKTRIIEKRNLIQSILDNQNGNRGFGQELDKLLIITADLRAQQRSRELYQAFIDGGMYAENILNSLFYKGIGSVPLSASLTTIQENNIRKAIGIDDAEVFILFIGVGNYPDNTFLTTRSERRPVEIEIL